MCEPWLASTILTAAGAVATHGGRVYPVAIPQGEPVPAITYVRTGTVRQHHQRGTGGWIVAQIDLRCWAPTYGESLSLADAIRRRLEGVQTTPNATGIRQVVVDDELDEPYLPQHAEEALTYCRLLRLSVQYTEPTLAIRE